MNRSKIICIVFLAASLGLTACSVSRKPIHTEESVRSVETKVEQISTITKKLIEMTQVSNDLDLLEKEGMSKADVNRIRRALKQKIRQLTNENVGLIKTL